MEEISIVRSVADHDLGNQSQIARKDNQPKAYSVEFWETINHVSVKVAHRYSHSENKVKRIGDIAQEELQEIIIYLQKNLEQSIAMVQEQEDELFIKQYNVRQLQKKVNIAHNLERCAWETKLKEAEELRNLLNKTLVGQRKNITKKREILLQYQQILKIANC